MSLLTDAGKATVRQACALFEISTSAYYGARQAGKRQRSAKPAGNEPKRRPWATAQELEPAVRAVVADHPAWGYRKVWATLRREPFGLVVSARRVWALMKAWGLCLHPDRERPERQVTGHVTVPEPNRRWATDMTTAWTTEDGLVAIAPVVDCGCRSALALGVSKAQDSATLLAPVNEALETEFGQPACVPDGLELLTDHGSQYTGWDCDAFCSQWGLQHRLSRVGRPTGNSVVERLIRTMKEECIWLRDWRSLAELREALAVWLRTYNERRPHQALGWRTPAEWRAEHQVHALRSAA